MGVEVRPLGVKCNLACLYCYQHPQRDAGNVAHAYDLEAMMRALVDGDEPFTLFGGEPLLVPKPDLERLFALGLELHGHTTIQTNAALIDDEHLDLFRRYRVQVGVSIDGPGALNDARWAGSGEATRLLTARSEAAIERLCAAGIATSLIITLHRGNASRERLPRLLAWLGHLDAIGVRGLRLHVLEVETRAVGDALALTPAESLAVHRAFAAASRDLPRLQIDVFRDLDALLRGRDDGVTCVWRACDPYTTEAVQGLEGDGQRSNCGRTNKDGVDFVKAATPGFERSIALYRTPERDGGCQGCRYFALCKGYCPGTAEGGDWRGRSDHCALWKALFADRERELLAAGVTPVSLHPRRHAIERLLVAGWSRGINLGLAEAIARVEAQDEEGGARGEDPPTPPLRQAWVSDRAVALWGPRLRAAAAAVRAVEIEAVRRGLLPAVIQSIAPRLRPELAARLAADGLALVALDRHRLPARDVEAPAAIGRPEALAQIVDAWADGSDAAILRLLGAPPCCVDAWSQADADARRDLAGEVRMTLGAEDVSAGTCSIDPVHNPLLRPLGLRATQHMSCGTGCAATAALAAALGDLGRTLGHAEALGWCDEALRWPMTWTGLHGLGELKTPVFKAVHACAYSAGLRRVVLAGARAPEAGAQGTVHPFVEPPRPSLSGGRRFLRGLEHVAAGEAPPSPPARRRALPVLASGRVGAGLDARVSPIDVDWRRMAEPQEDGYDAEIALAAARVHCSASGRPDLLRWPLGDAPTIFAGTVAVRHVSRRSPLGPELENGPLTHPNIAAAVAQVARWPAAYRQIQRLVHTFHPLVDPRVPEVAWAGLSGSCSHTFPEWFGAIFATIYDPLGLAQAFVHEVAHTKLRALGVDIERASALIRNPPGARYLSPIRTDIPRPMTAVFHAVYSFIHVTELDLRMLEHAGDPALRRRVLDLLGRNVPRMRAGLAVIEGDIVVDAAGEAFLAGFLPWARRVLDDGERRLAAG